MILQKVQNTYLFQRNSLPKQEGQINLECSKCHSFYKGHTDSLLCDPCTQSVMRSSPPLRASIFDILKSKEKDILPDTLIGA